jgi:hypothetical protein
MKKQKGIRVTVEFSQELYNDLETLETIKQVSKAAILRNAIKLQKLLFDAENDGNLIILHDVNTGKEKQVILMG